MTFRCLIRRGIALLPVIAVAGGCGNRDASQPTTTAETVPATPPVAGIQTFVIVPAESKASYHASEEFFPAALAKLGIDAGDIDDLRIGGGEPIAHSTIKRARQQLASTFD